MRTLVVGTADRLVALFDAGVDPDPELTWARGVTLAVDDGATRKSASLLVSLG